MALYEIAKESDKLENSPTVSPFSRAMIFHMDRYGLTIEQGANRSGLDVMQSEKCEQERK